MQDYIQQKFNMDTKVEESWIYKWICNTTKRLHNHFQSLDHIPGIGPLYYVLIGLIIKILNALIDMFLIRISIIIILTKTIKKKIEKLINRLSCDFVGKKT